MVGSHWSRHHAFGDQGRVEKIAFLQSNDRTHWT
jgi:hypothetical protein